MILCKNYYNCHVELDARTRSYIIVKAHGFSFFRAVLLSILGAITKIITGDSMAIKYLHIDSVQFKVANLDISFLILRCPLTNMHH